jgi:DNA polymerase-3 subunit gamma/tau
MPEQVLYRKWRSQRFADLVGQEHVVQTLRQAVSQDRVAHAYLFCGPRGTGKTSAARILAKALNCESLGPNAEGSNNGDPDNTCPFCIDVSEGRALDLVEMDAASHRGIDDVRSLQERVFGAGPAQGRAKVYIIDEAHMLTDFAFNALLKTLEEPAPWAYFILCTTEPHKLLATIVSRCQRFDFRRIAPKDLQAHLQTVCEGEGFTFEEQALSTIARATGGSARDALNILEQTALSYGNAVTLAGVKGLLGLSEDSRSLDLVRTILSGSLGQSLAVLNDVTSSGLEPGPFHREVVERMRAVLLYKSGVGATDDSLEIQDAVKAIADATDMNVLLRAMRLVGKVNLRSGDGPSWLPLELAIIECASAPEEIAAPAVIAPAPPPARAPAPPPRQFAPQQSTPNNGPSPSRRPPWEDQPQPARDLQPSQTDSMDEPARIQPVPSAAPSAVDIPIPAGATVLDDAQWNTLVQPLKRARGKKFVLGSLLLDCRARYTEEDKLTLVFKNSANRDRLQEELEHPPSRLTFEAAVSEALGGSYNLKLEAVETDSTSSNVHGHLVRAAVALGAKVIPDKENSQ